MLDTILIIGSLVIWIVGMTVIGVVILTIGNR